MLESVSDADEFLDRVSAYRYTPSSVLVECGIPFLREYTEQRPDSLWKAVTALHSIKPDLRLYNACVRWSVEHPVNPGDVFLGTWALSPNSPYHSLLMGRIRETMTYGLFKPFHWLSFFAALGLSKSTELRFIAGFIEKAQGMPYKVSKGDNSKIDLVSLFYNIQNLIETQLNVANLRSSLHTKVITLVTSELGADGEVYRSHDVHLDSLLNELSLHYGVAPKQICKEIRNYLTLVIRAGGIYAYKQKTYKHNRLNLIDHDRSGLLEEVEFLGEKLFKPFYETATMRTSMLNGQDTLKRLGFVKLNAAINVYLRTSLLKTSRDHFVIFASFLHGVMALAGYGRALSYASAP